MDRIEPTWRAFVTAFPPGVATYLGLLVTVVGFLLAIIQIQRTLGAAKAARLAAEGVENEALARDLWLLLSNFRRLDDLIHERKANQAFELARHFQLQANVMLGRKDRAVELWEKVRECCEAIRRCRWESKPADALQTIEIKKFLMATGQTIGLFTGATTKGDGGAT